MPIPYRNRKIKTLEDLDLQEKKVFLRVDFNVPLSNGKISDDTRIQAALPTLRFLLEAKAKMVIASHLGRPKGKVDPKYSLFPVAEHLAELLRQEVAFTDESIGNGVRRILSDASSPKMILLENLRFHPEEEGNSLKFAMELKNGCDVYLSDAFGALHRAHASTDALPRKFSDRGIGFLVKKELQALSPLLGQPERPFSVLLGGAKISDKLKVIEKLITKVDELYLGGAMVFTFLKALGRKVGNSLVEDSFVPHAIRILNTAKGRNIRIYLPSDFVLGKSVESPGEAKLESGRDIPDGWMGLDIGPKTIEQFSEGLKKAKTLFWNGPMGLFEKPPFDRGTIEIAKNISELKSFRVVGGGDSVAALSMAKVTEKIDHVSTGGGATLEFVEGLPLPGLESLAV